MLGGTHVCMHICEGAYGAQKSSLEIPGARESNVGAESQTFAQLKNDKYC